MVSLSKRKFKDTPMNCDLTKNRFVDEDFVFIILNLLNQSSPQNEAVFDFKSLRTAKYRNIHRLKNKELFETVAKIKTAYGIDVGNAKFDFREFYLSASNSNKEEMDFVMEGDHDEEEYIIKEKIAKNDFAFEDIERLGNLLTKEKNDFDDINFNEILGGINFTATISTKSKNKIKRNLDRYITAFVDEELLPDEKVYRSYTEHKKILLPELYKTAKEYGKNTAIGTSRKDVHYRFIEPLIRLEEQGYIKIHELNIIMDDIGLNQYRATIKIEEKLTKDSKYAKSEKPHAGLIDISEGTGWDKIHLILCENYDIKVKFDNKTFVFDSEKFGFNDKRRKDMATVKESWDFLLFLAIKKGVFPIKDISTLNNFIAGTRESTKKLLTKEDCQKRKGELTKILRNAFPQIKVDPFDKWDENKEEYKINIKLTPTEPFRDDFRDRKIKDDAESNPHADLSDYLADQTHER